MSQVLPSRILSSRGFSGVDAAGEKRQDALARYSDAGEIARALMRAADAGFGGVMTVGDERILGALREVRRTRPGFEVLPVIPNVLGYVREATEYGLAGAGLRRLARVGLAGFLRAGVTGALHAPQVLAKHFPTLLTILYELEMGELHRLRPPAVFLHHQMTDLALAFDNRAVFEMFAERMRRRFGAEPGLATSNFARLASRLRAWGVPIRLIAAPMNRMGWLMPGGAAAIRGEIEAGDFMIVADRVSAETATAEEDVAWAGAQRGVVSVVTGMGDPTAAEPVGA